MSVSAPGAGLALIQREREVEASLWRRLRYEHDEQCRPLLFGRHARLARVIANAEFRRRPPYGLERSDFEQLAFGGLLEAIDKFDPTRGSPFEPFARHRIRGAIADGVARSSENAAQYTQRRRIEQDRLRSLHSDRTSAVADPIQELSDLAIALAVGLIAENASGLEDAPSGPYESRSWHELQTSVLSEIDRLPDREKVVLQQHYLNGVSFVQIASLLRLTKGRVSQIHAQALKRVRERLRQID